LERSATGWSGRGGQSWRAAAMGTSSVVVSLYWARIVRRCRWPRASGRDLHGLGQDCVERLGELPGPAADQEPEIPGAITKIHQEIADLLHGPWSVRVRGDSQDMHIPGSDLDPERAVQARQGHRAVHVEEVGREHRRRLRVQELPPRRGGAPPGRRRDLQRLQDPADRRCTYPGPTLSSSPGIFFVSPAVVLGGEPHDERGNLGAEWRPSRPVRIVHLRGEHAALPAQDGAGGHQPVRAQPSRQEPDQRGEDRLVGPVQPGRGWARRSTATACRSTRSSASLAADDRASRTSQPHSRTKMR
jgi:hypothetical protein